MQTHSLADPLVEAGLPDGVRALVVADDPLLRERFVDNLGPMAVAQAATADDLAEIVARTAANIVVWDLGPSTPADPALGALRVPVVVLTAGAGRANPLLAAGARGVLRRDGKAPLLRASLAPVLHGLQVVDPSLADKPAPAGTLPPDVSVETLTNRETEVVSLIATGLSNKQIASQLGISAHTVKFHVNAILAKLDVHSRTEAVVRAVQMGVVAL